MVSQYLDICGGHWSSATGDVKYLTRHVTSQDYAIEDHVTLWMGALHYMLPNCQVWWPQALW